MNTPVRFAALLAFLGTLGWSALSLACGATPEPARALTGSWPDEGEANVPLDAALLIDQAPGPSAWSVEVRLTRADDGAEVPGIVDGFGAAVRFQPEAALAPHTEYLLVAALAEGQLFDPNLGGVERMERRFTTGEARLNALRAPEPTFRFEAYDAPVADCGGQRLIGETASLALAGARNGGCPPAYDPTGCVADGTMATARAHVELGPVAGGQAERGYAVAVWLTDREPYYDEPADDPNHDVLLADWKLVQTGETAAIDIDLPEEARDYTACMTVSIRDASGRTLRPEPFCALRSSAFDLLASDPGDGRDDGNGANADGAPGVPPDGVAGGVAPVPSESAMDGSASDAACRAVGAGASAPALGWVAVALLGLRSRRRR